MLVWTHAKNGRKREAFLIRRCEENDQEGDKEDDGWIASERTCRNCGSPQMMPRTEYSGNQEFGLKKKKI